MPPSPHYDVLVLGAGINGLCTALALHRRGAGRIGVVEQFPLLHAHGSSHGASRITRSSYAHPTWVRLVQLAQGEEWPRLEAAAGQRLVIPRPALFWGPVGGPIDAYRDAVVEVGAAVDELSPEAAAQAFPTFRFQQDDRVLRDRTAGIVLAGDTMAALVRLLRAAGVDLHEATPVQKIHTGADIELRTAGGPLSADRLVVTAGSWAARLLPGLQGHLAVARQSVGYFGIEGDPTAMPPWVYLGTNEDERYGLPQVGRPGIKAAQHRTHGGSDDPDDSGPEPDLSEVEAFLRQRLIPRLTGVLGRERCLYTNTPDNFFVLDRVPGEPRITVGAGCSGHGFKFGPLTGRILAGLCLDGITDVPPFEAARARFGWPG